tara:strand:- start:3610 stop:4362 length:753 start_codon:yes stop_codon:yes gene_type:complete
MSEKNHNIKGKVVVITGASSGIGEAAAIMLGKAGAKVVLGARRLDRLENIVSKIVEEGGEAVCCNLDVSSSESVQAFISFAIECYEDLDVVVNNAGIMPLSMMAELKCDEWNSMVDINLKGVLHTIAAVLPHFTAKKSGHIINITSVGDRVIVPTATVYSATKYAVRAITQGLRQEVAEFGIKTTLIAPGAVDTELFESISNPELKAMMLQRSEGALSPDCIAGAICYAIEQPEHVDISELVIRPIPSSI